MLRITWVKYEKDKESFLVPKRLGMDVIELQDLEQTDKKLEELVQKNCTAIIVSNEVASFSQDIIQKYAFDENVNILISPTKKKE